MSTQRAAACDAVPLRRNTWRPNEIFSLIFACFFFRYKASLLQELDQPISLFDAQVWYLGSVGVTSSATFDYP